MQWCKNKIYEDQYYKITKDGDQRSMMDGSPCEYILHIHKNNKTLQYHFIKPYHSYEIQTPYTVLGMAVHIHSKAYIIPADSFLIRGNELFNETFMLWMCKHYLYIKPCKSCVATIIDTDATIHSRTILVVENQL